MINIYLNRYIVSATNKMATPTKDQLTADHTRIHEYLLKDFESKLASHHEEKHTFMIQGSVHGICRDLQVDKQTAIYLILGANPRNVEWGQLRETHDIEPLKYILRREIVKRGCAVMEDTMFMVYFGDRKGNGDFQMKIDFFPKGKKKVIRKKNVEETDSVIDIDSVAEKDDEPVIVSKPAAKTWAKVVKPAREHKTPKVVSPILPKTIVASKSSEEKSKLLEEKIRLLEEKIKLLESSA